MRLSVCIPTYNFGAFIGETLQSIAAQLQDGVEIVVLDGGSSDDTAGVVEAFARGSPAHPLPSQAERGGIDRDMARTVALAQGDTAGCSVLTTRCGRVPWPACSPGSMAALSCCCAGSRTASFRWTRSSRARSLGSRRTRVDFSIREQRLDISSERHHARVFSFLGSIVFKRERWEEIGSRSDSWQPVRSRGAAVRDDRPGRHSTTCPTPMCSRWRERLVSRPRDRQPVRQGDRRLHDLAAAYFGAGSAEAAHVRRAVRTEFPLWLALELRGAVATSIPSIGRAASDRHRAYGEPGSRYRLYREIYDHPRTAGSWRRAIDARAARRTSLARRRGLQVSRRRA